MDKRFESVILIKPNLSKSKMDSILMKIESKIKEVANITGKQELGKRKLAYEIKDNKEAYYMLYQFTLKEDIKKEAISTIERFYRITDEIMKYIVVDKEE